jgi:hypothetical protein
MYDGTQYSLTPHTRCAICLALVDEFDHRLRWEKTEGDLDLRNRLE